MEQGELFRRYSKHPGKSPAAFTIPPPMPPERLSDEELSAGFAAIRAAVNNLPPETMPAPEPTTLFPLPETILGKWLRENREKDEGGR